MKNQIFEINPNLKEVFMTSDGQCFYNENDAKMHGKALENKQVELVLNPKFVSDIEVIDPKDLNFDSSDATALEKMTKAELLEFSKSKLNVELSTKSTKPELLNLIDELLKKEAPAEGAPAEGAPAEGVKEEKETKTQD